MGRAGRRPTHVGRGRVDGRGLRSSAKASKDVFRHEYEGFCPLRPTSGASSDFHPVERRRLVELDAGAFFSEFVKKRRPVILEADGVPGGPLAALFGLRGADARWAQAGSEGTAALREAVGVCAVVAEKRQGKNAAFGQSDAGSREKVEFAEFCQHLEKGSELGYMTTQPLPEDSDGCPTALAAPHLLKLLQPAETLRPSLIGKLAPVQYNLWFGRSATGSTSGLHHDFHDNIYVLLRGTKEFRLFSPRCVDVLQPVGARAGRRAKVHANGLICYAPGIRDDGAPSAAVRGWKRRMEQSAMRAESANGTCGQQTASKCTFSDDSDEAALEQALDDAIEGNLDSASDNECMVGTRNLDLPDSFCEASTVLGGVAPNIPAPLTGKHAVARLQTGDMLYLPASWFHEVISWGADAGGHLALNLWMAPPHSRGTFHAPYEDEFWETKYQALRAAAFAKCPDVHNGGHTAPAGGNSKEEAATASAAARNAVKRVRRRKPWTHQRGVVQKIAAKRRRDSIGAATHRNSSGKR